MPGTDRFSVDTDGLTSQMPDVDPQETAEWLESLDAVIAAGGETRARFLMLKMLEHATHRHVGVPGLRSTDYVNTISAENEPYFPGDEALERRIRRYVRWNAAVLVSRANRPEVGVGGHIASFASAASLYEVGFNHFFRGKDDGGSGDQVYMQGHASPGIYARAFLEGRLTEQQLDSFRQESLPTGIPSYPHPRLMPDFWEFPTVSMGLSPIASVYQARFNRYLTARGIADTSDSHVWAYMGDGEMDEPESLGAIGVAARENLDNLTFIINCNLQRLDGPVRGNGKIIQELEGYFRGAGWNVIKVVWGREWDALLTNDRTGALVHELNTTPDGQFQTYSIAEGSFIREGFFGRNPELRKLVEHLSDEELTRLSRGGHDYRKVYAAFSAARAHTGQPTVILAQTVKGWTLGTDFEARNASHQMKKLNTNDFKAFRDRLQLPISDRELESGLPPYYHPGPNSEEVQYLQEQRRKLHGYLPKRVVRAKPLPQPADDMYSQLLKGSGRQEVATTMAFVRLLRDLMRSKEIGARFVPIIPDEARTFGMDSLFPTAKIYSPHGQTYDPVDRELVLSYREHTEGQILHEGITEAGSMASVIAAGSSYSTHGQHMIPIYIFYSMFGFQRTGDQMWAMADQLSRGFLLGATAGRTTLNGEGLQHEDGHSLLLASQPGMYRLRPGVGVRDGVHRQGRPTPDVRGEPRGRLLLPDHLQRAQAAAGRARDRGAGAEGAARPVPLRRLTAPGGEPAEGADPGQRNGDPLGARRPAAARRGVGRRRGRMVGDVLERAAPRRRRVRRVEPAEPRGDAAGSVRHGRAPGRCRPVRRGQRLDAHGSGPDLALGAG